MKTSSNIVAAAFAFAVAFAPKYAAADAEWGCEILLCAASSAPTWHGIAYCVPPMTKLIAAMKLPGFSWPSCTAAGTKEPGYDPYLNCPAGTVIGYTENSNARDGSSSYTPNLCVVPKSGCSSNLYQSKRDMTHDTVSMECETPLSAMYRPTRANPYYFDIKDNSGVAQRFYFNLVLD
ncbi:hypothetical protein FS815_27455 [Agrobacterium vitis]|uniref:hypothetical protein n=1 Tax=Allorhizobium ampelinum TaxID=3025782 RepID=UPI001F258498|nr:hypothetical protein [Allorhizobium ampelinum]MCF1450513.1 hypothetical protein [Allorhizobium ampelinum]